MKSERALRSCILTALILLFNSQTSFSANDPAAQTVAAAAPTAPTSAVPVVIPYTTTARAKSVRSSHSLDARMSILHSTSDPYSAGLSPEAVQLADQLHITDKLKRLQQMQQQVLQSGNQKPSVELRQDLADLKIELLTTIEQTRLEIDFVTSEIEEENARFFEWLKTFEQDRDNRVNRANAWAFRTNGVLWAVAEALDIPTYRTPKYSISSGAIGIVAGLVPSIFTAYALRSGSGEKYERNAHPNMLSKVYGFPTHEGIEYPETVWTYLNMPPPGTDKRSRREMLIDHWVSDINIHIFKNGVTKDDLVLLTGAAQPKVDIELLHDRMTMLSEVEAATLQMNRPLLEINMAMQGKKKLAD
ncbi:MAG TPA: hypothetical protein V6C69_20740 [Trichormus sp.]